MQDSKLLEYFLNADSEEAILEIFKLRGLLNEPKCWRYLGGMPNNQSIVQAQQSNAGAALIEKITNGFDAILLRFCKAQGIDPRGEKAPKNMAVAVEEFLGNLSAKDSKGIRKLAEEYLILYATGSKSRPSISLYDAGEGQLAKDFPSTFCSLIYGSDNGSYKGAIPFVQGRFNMGSTGVLPFCSEERKLQLIVSRVPDAVANTTDHEWAFTIFCFFHSKQNPAWKYLVGEDGNILTAGIDPIKLLPLMNAKSGEVLLPRERAVASGTLIKMYDYKAPRSNVCGELFKKIEEYLLRPAMPLRIVECRSEYKANVMGVTVWDRLGAWAEDKLEAGFEDGASISITLTTGETLPAEVRVFKTKKGMPDEEQPQTGLRAMINGQSHAKRDNQFFRTKAVDKEHIAGSLLVTIDCTELGQESRNALFMSNRETFREDPLLQELLKKLQKELHDHEGLIAINNKRYEEKIANAVDDEDGINALEELLSTDPHLADLFGSMNPGKVAASTANQGTGGKVDGEKQPYVGLDFPTFFKRADGSTSVNIEVPSGGHASVSFKTDVKNNYFTRRNNRGHFEFTGEVVPTQHLFNGRLTLTFSPEKNLGEGSFFNTEVIITDNVGSGPFKLTINGLVVAPREEKEKNGDAKEKREKNPPKAEAGPSRPDIREVEGGPDDPPLTIERVPETNRLQLVLNKGSKLLVDAKAMRPKEEAAAVEFVFKYGLALTAMGLLDAVKKTPEWTADEAACRDKIQQTAAGMARIIVPLCLSLPKKLPKSS
jgi:hypothetical protein